MERIELSARIKEETRKKANKKLRKDGFVPAVVYKSKQKTIHLIVKEKDLLGTLGTKAGENVLINLNLDEGPESKDKSRVVIIKEIQRHPIKDNILHVDFKEISLTEKITVVVPVVVKGEPAGIAKDEGIIEHVLWEVKVECLPADIPEKIEVNVVDMKVGDSILVKDLKVSQGVKVIADPEQAVISVVLPHVEKVEEVPAESVAEPELIREKKEKEEEEEEEAKAEKETPPAEEKKQEKK